jgi:hypothetical protein
MMRNSTTIQCPHCGESINVNDVLVHQIEAENKEKFQEKLNELAKERAQFEKDKERENELFEERLAQAKKTVEKTLQDKIKKQLEEEQKDSLAELQKELSDKSEKLKEFNKMQVQISKLQREKLEMKESIELENQKKFDAQILEEKEKIRKKVDDENALKFATLQKQLEDQKKLTEEMKRKQEQGSMQLQGEIQELAIEEYLTNQFPLDTIEEIKKGANGADCLQIVNTFESQNCGTIYYESKRTKNFSPAWIEKFKNDIREKKADIGVLVTEVLPSDMERMGLKDGVWICTFEEFKGLVTVLRQSIINLDIALQSQENKGDKMAMLYDFLTSTEFRMQIEGIVEGFSQMQDDLAKEKRAMQKIWSQREKQIDKVIANTVNMYGSIRGIAGNAIQTVKALELDENLLIENSIEHE